MFTATRQVSPSVSRSDRPFRWRRSIHFLALAVASSLLTEGINAADTGVPVPPGTWTLVLTKGVPAATNGWEQLVYVPALKRSIMLSLYHQRNSEPNESLVGYHFDTNTWDVVDMGGNFHTENMPEGGESQGYFDFNPNNNTIVYHCCTTGSNQTENINHTWWYDVLGQSGRDKHTSPKPPAPALQPGGVFDVAHNVFVFHGGDSFVGTWTYDPVANTWLRMTPGGTLPNPSLILPGLAYSTNNQKVYLVGGISSTGYNSDLYVYDYPTNTWSLINPAGGVKPPARYRHAFAYDSTNNIFLLYGGQNASGILNDTWVYDPSANTWTQLNLPQAPPVPTSAIFARMSYDSDHNVFVLAQLGQNGYYGGNWTAYAIQTWLFRYQGTGPNAGALAPSALPSSGGLNRNAASWAKDPALASSGSSLYVAWSEVGSPYNASDIAWPHIYVDQYTGGSWNHLGSSFQSVSSSAIKEAHSPSLAVIGGVPWSSWYESDNAGNFAAVYAKSWDGASAWNGGAVGVNSASTRLFQGQSQIIGVGTVPHVAVLEVDKDVSPQRTFAYVKSWDGTGWTMKGAALNKKLGAGSTALSVSIAGDGTNPYAAWSEYMHSANNGSGYDNDTNPQIYVSQWNGTQWVAMGGSLNIDPSNWAYDPSIAFLNGSLYVAWTERTPTGNAQLYVKTWNGTGWSLVGAGALNRAPGAGWAYHPSLIADAASNTLYLGWVEQLALGQKAQVYISRYSGGSWSSLGGSLNVDPIRGSAQRVSLGVYNGQPVAAWGEVNMGALRQIYVKQWFGSSWTLLPGLGAPDTTAPAVPTNLSATAVSSSQINLVWARSSDLVGVTGYLVYRGGAQIADVTSTLAYTDTGLSPNTAYPYRVVAYDAAGNLSSQSAAISATTFMSPAGSGGSLAGSMATPPGTVQLTAEGSSDWAHWGLNSAGSFDHRAGVTQQISNYTLIGQPATQYANNPVAYTWTNGTPTATVSNTATGIFTSGQAQGFRITAPADATVRTLRVYVGVFRTQGRMVAQLSDGSAADYVDTSLTNNAVVPTSGVYTFTYTAASAGQSLIVTFTQNAASAGNIELQAATLVAGAPPPDFAVSSSPSSQTVVRGNSVGYTVTVTGSNGFTGTTTFGVTGLPAGVTTVFNPGTVTGSGSTTMTLTAASGTASGTYPVIVTASSGAISHTANVSLTVSTGGVGGVLSGSSATPPTSVQLTNEGSVDWAHWGMNTAIDFNRKAGVSPQISNFTSVAGGSALRYTANPTAYTWTDGTPTASASNIATGLYLSGQGQGFRITAPADTTVRTLRVYVGAWQAQAQMLAQLSDGSAVDYVDTSLVHTSGPVTLRVYAFSYSAASGGQNLTVTFTQMNATSGNINLQAATLSGGAVTPDFTVTATPPSQNVVAGSSVSYTVNISALNGFAGTTGLNVAGLPAGATAGFSPNTITGSGSSTMGVTTLAGTTPGNYPLTITANSGLLTHTANVILIVTGTGALSGSLATPAVSVQLTTEGTADWAHWGMNTSTDFNHKAGVVAQIGNLASIAGGALTRYTANPTSYTWTDGTPTLSASNIATGLYVAGQNQGFRLVVPADTTLRTLRVYLGVWRSQARMVAHLSDGSAVDYTDTSLVNTSGPVTLGVYAFSYSAASAGQTLTLTFTQLNATSGNINFQAATLTSGVPTPDFSVAATPATQSTPTGGSASYNVTISPLSGFTGTVGFAISGLPAGATAGFSPASVTNGGSSTLTVTTAAGTASGSYPLLITASSGALQHTAAVTLNVSDFSVTATPATRTVVVGGSATYTVSVSALSGFTGTVGFAISGLPAGATAGFSPASVTNSGSSTLTVTTAAGTASGSYPLSITASGGTLQHTAAVTLNVTDFSVTATPATRTVVVGGSAAYTVSVSALNGFTGTVAFAISGLPSGTTSVFSPTTVAGSGSSTLTLTAASTAAGNYPLTITASSGTLFHTVDITLNVTDFSVSATPGTQSTVPGGSAGYNVSITALNGFAGTVGFAVSGLPGGATVGFSPSSIPGSGSSTMTVTTAPGTAAANYPMTITASSGTASHTANVTLSVGGSPDFMLGLTPSTATASPGGSANYTVNVTALSGFSGTVSFNVTNLPAGAIASFNPMTVTGSGSSIMTVTTAPGTPATNYPVTLNGTSGALSHIANAVLTVSIAGTGLLSGSIATPAASVQLTNEGTTDWAHWGMNTATDFNHKAGVVSQISNVTSVFGGTIARYTANPTSYSWTDGTPNASASNIATGIYLSGQNQGFRITVPADTTLRTLRVYVGAWRAQAKMIAHLSDGSAADYVDTTLVNTSGAVVLGVYTFTYSAGSSGQTLTLTFTQMNLTSGNINFQAATLSGGSVTPNFSLSATPASQSVGAGSNANYAVNISALNGFSGTVGFNVSGLPPGATASFSPTTVTAAGSSTMTVTTLGGTAPGSYSLTITGTDGTLTHTTNVSLNIAGAGLLSGSLGTPPASVQLTTEGTADWAHWGMNTSTDFNHKAGVVSQIGNLASVAGGAFARYTANPTGYTWTDGSPTLSASNIATGLYVSGQNQGFRLVLPADTNLRTLRVYLGVWRTRGKIVAHLSDGSAVDFTDSTLNNPSGPVALGSYTISYKAGSSGQTLTLTFTQLDATAGNVNFQAATLQ